MYYLCGESKGADQLHGYRKADLRLFFSHMQKSCFLMTRLILHWATSEGTGQHAYQSLL